MIYKYWKDNAELGQEDVSFSYNILAVNKNISMAHWRANFKRLPSGNRVKLDGIFKLLFPASQRAMMDPKVTRGF